MSIAAMQWAKQQRTGSSASKLVLLIMADYASPGPDDGPKPDTTGRHYLFAGQRRIADECEMSVESVRRHQLTLVQQGLCRKVRRFDARGNRISDFIVLAVDDHRPRPFETESGSHHRQDPTSGQSDRRSPVTGGPAGSSDRWSGGAPIAEPPEGPNQEDSPAGRSGPPAGSAQDAPTRIGTERAQRDAAASLAESLMARHRGVIAIRQDQLAQLLLPSFHNGVPLARLERAVGMLLRDGKQLASWTLQEYVGKAAASSRLGAFA